MRRTLGWLAGGLALGLGVLSGWAAAGAGGSIERAPAAVLVIAASLGGAGLVVGAFTGFRKRATWWSPLVLLCGFYIGTWMNSPYHSVAGDTLVLALASVPTCIGTVLGFAVGQYVADRGASTPRL